MTKSSIGADSAPRSREPGDDARRGGDPLIPRPPKGREAAPTQISRLLRAHEVVLKEARTMARLAAQGGDDGTNGLIVSDVIRRNELQAWFVAEHVVDVPLTHAV